MEKEKYTVKYFLNFYANSGRKYRRHAINNVRIYKNFNHGNPTDLIFEFESPRQDVILKEIKPFTTKAQRDCLKKYGMKSGRDLIILHTGTYFI